MKRIRKSLALMLALALCLSLAACGEESDPAPAPSSIPESSSVSESAPIPAPSSDPELSSDPGSAPNSEPVSTPEPTSAPAPAKPAEETGESRNSALDDVPLIAVPDWFESSIWEYDGGMVDNKELDDAAARRLLEELCHGRMVISVNPNGAATMVFGTGEYAAMYPGSWKASRREVAMNFPEVGSYTARLTEVAGDPVMMLTVEDNITFYLLPLSTFDVPSSIGGMPAIDAIDVYEDECWTYCGWLKDGQEPKESIENQYFLSSPDCVMELTFRETGRADFINAVDGYPVYGVWQLQDNVLGFAFYPEEDEPIYYTGFFAQRPEWIRPEALVLIMDRHNSIYLGSFDNAE